MKVNIVGYCSENILALHILKNLKKSQQLMSPIYQWKPTHMTRYLSAQPVVCDVRYAEIQPRD